VSFIWVNVFYTLFLGVLFQLQTLRIKTRLKVVLQDVSSEMLILKDFFIKSYLSKSMEQSPS